MEIDKEVKEKRLPLTEHLEELRTRIIFSIIAISSTLLY